MPRVLDLFSGGGGAAEGYADAGFEVVGVDRDRQPAYPFEFRQMDALEAIEQFACEFDLVHASPPCQGYSSAVSSRSSRYVPTLGKDEPRLIAPVREALERAGVPYVIENVVSPATRAELRDPILLCGSMIGRPIPRHRLFETTFEVEQPVHPDWCRGMAKRYAEQHGIDYRDMSMTGKGRRAGIVQRVWAPISGIRHPMRQHDYSEAILPGYTLYIGRQFLAGREDLWSAEEREALA